MSPVVGVDIEESRTLVIAPVSGQSDRYVEFKVQPHSVPGNTSDNGNGLDLVRTVISASDLTDDLREKYLVSYPVGQQPPKCPKHLRTLTIIDSKKSGRGTSGELYFGVLSPLLQELGCFHVYVATHGPETIREHARSFSSSSTVVIIGGDTSVHEFVDALSPQSGDEEMRIVIIPSGTGNALASSLNITSSVIAMRRLLMGSVEDFKPLSTFRVDFPSVPQSTYSLVVASWGLHSAIVADSDTPELRKFGSERFRIAARHNLEEIEQKYTGTVSDLPEAAYPQHSYLLFTTVTQLEAGFLISPKSDPPSSKTLWGLRIPVLPEAKQLMDIMYEVYDKGSHINDPRVTYFSVPSQASGASQGRHPITVTVSAENTPHMRRWCIDGRIIVSEPGDVLIHPPSHNCKGWDLRILV